MKHYTEAERTALVNEIKYNRENCFCSEKTLELFSIAESALAAKPVGVFAKREGVWLELYTGDTFEHPDAIYLYSATTTNKLKIPEEVPAELRVALHAEIGTDGYNNQRIWEIVTSEVQRLNGIAL